MWAEVALVSSTHGGAGGGGWSHRIGQIGQRGNGGGTDSTGHGAILHAACPYHWGHLRELSSRSASRGNE